jgi:S1-C subfamily serine protease
MTPRLGQSLGIPTKRGVIVLGLEVDSPAARAGLEPFDVIVSINKRPVGDYASADRAIFGLRIGDTIELGVERMGTPLTFRFPLEADPNLSPVEGPRS